MTELPDAPTLAAALEPPVASRSARVAAVATSSLVRQITATFGTRLAGLGVAMVLGIVVARVLGPAGRGEYAEAVALTVLAAQFGNLGLHASNTYYLARDRSLLPTLLGNSIAVSCGVGALAAAVLVALRVAVPSVVPLHPVILTWVILAVPVSVALLLAQNLALALGRVRTYNRSDLSARLIGMSFTGVLITAQVLSPTWLFSATIVASAVVTLWLVRDLGKHAEGVGVRWRVFQDTWAYGARAYLAALAAYVVLRIDIVLLGALSTLRDTGLYSVAVALGDLTIMLPTVAGSILFPRLSGITDPLERWLLARRVTITVGLLMLGACVVAGLVARPAIRLLYGAPYADASSAYLVLLPGLACLSITMLLNNFLAATGMPLITVISPLVAGAVNIVANLLLIPAAGIVGSALASTIAYALMLLGAGGYIALRPQVRGHSRKERTNV